MCRRKSDPRSRITYEIDTAGCHICISHAKNRDGYPIIKINGRSQSISRFMWEAENGPIPRAAVIRHTCDNRACINLAHLVVGTPQDNVRDRVERNRSATGSQNGRAKLDELDVRVILLSTLKDSELARVFDVSPKSIYDIRHGNRWKETNASGENIFLGFCLVDILEEMVQQERLPSRPIRWQDLLEEAAIWSDEMQNDEFLVPSYEEQPLYLDVLSLEDSSFKVNLG